MKASTLLLLCSGKAQVNDSKEMAELKKRRKRTFKHLALKSTLDNFDVSCYKAARLVEKVLSPYIYLMGTISISVALEEG